MSPKLFRGMISEGFGNDMIEVMIPPPPHIFISVYTLTKKSSREKSYCIDKLFGNVDPKSVGMMGNHSHGVY